MRGGFQRLALGLHGLAETVFGQTVLVFFVLGVGLGSGGIGLGVTDQGQELGGLFQALALAFQAVDDLAGKGGHLAGSGLPGGVTGLGLGNSIEKQLWLPESNNDFIFSVVCEELGLIGACLILLLFALLIIRGYWLALHARDKFGSLIIVGITTLFAFQVFANVAVVPNLFPVTGISQPIFSSGGSALIIQMAEMGLILSISRQNPVT